MMFRPQELRHLIQTHGRELVFTSKSSISYDPITGSVSSVTQNYNVFGYFYNYKLEDLGNDNLVLGDRGLVISTVDTSGFAIPEPKADDTFSGSGDTVRVVSSSKIISTGTICYLCRVRE